MRSILFITHENLNKTAVSKAMFEDIAVALQTKRMANVTIMSAGDESSSELRNGVRYARFKRSSYGKVSISAFASLLKSFFLFLRLAWKADICFYRSYPSFLMFGWVSWILRKKNIFDTRGLFFDELFDSGKISNLRLKRIFTFVEIILLKISDRIIAVTEAQARHYASLTKGIAKKIFVIPNGAPVKDIISSKLDSEVLELVYVGSLVKWHSPELVKDVCLHLGQRGVKYKLTVMTPDLNTAHTVFGELGANVEIKTHDYRNKPIRFHYGFCFISGGLSKEICFPVKFLEYIQSGTKVISSSNVKVTSDLTSKFKLGISIDISKNTSIIVDEIQNEINSNSLRIVRLPSHLTFENQVKSIEELLMSV